LDLVIGSGASIPCSIGLLKNTSLGGSKSTFACRYLIRETLTSNREFLMRFYTRFATGMAVCLLTVAPALAQDAPKATTSDPQKQETQGVPAGTTPPQYGAAANKQQTQGVPAGTMPPQYGANSATKQQTQGVPAGTTPTQYGSLKQHTQGVPAGTVPTQYSAMKQHTQGVPAGTTPTQFGAMKQHTQGVPAGTTPTQYGAIKQ
jgi:hypothetical protein